MTEHRKELIARYDAARKNLDHAQAQFKVARMKADCQKETLRVSIEEYKTSQETLRKPNHDESKNVILDLANFKAVRLRANNAIEQLRKATERNQVSQEHLNKAIADLDAARAAFELATDELIYAQGKLFFFLCHVKQRFCNE